MTSIGPSAPFRPYLESFSHALSKFFSETFFKPLQKKKEKKGKNKKTNHLLTNPNCYARQSNARGLKTYRSNLHNAKKSPQTLLAFTWNVLNLAAHFAGMLVFGKESSSMKKDHKKITISLKTFVSNRGFNLYFTELRLDFPLTSTYYPVPQALFELTPNIPYQVKKRHYCNLSCWWRTRSSYMVTHLLSVVRSMNDLFTKMPKRFWRFLKKQS